MSTDFPISRESIADFLNFYIQNQSNQESQEPSPSTESIRVLPDSSCDVPLPTPQNPNTNYTNIQALNSGGVLRVGGVTQLGLQQRSRPISIEQPPNSIKRSTIYGNMAPVHQVGDFPNEKISVNSLQEPTLGGEGRIQRMNSADARMEEFLNTLEAVGSNSNSSVSSSGLRALPDSDPQTLEINRLVQELERLQDLDSQPSHLMNKSVKLEPMIPDISASQVNQQIQLSSNHDGSPRFSRIQHQQLNVGSSGTGLKKNKVKTHPALADLLLNTVEDAAHMPPVPLKEQPYQPTGDPEGARLFMKNAQHCLKSHALSVDTEFEMKSNLTRAQSMGDINANLLASVPMVRKPAVNVMLGQGTMLSPQDSRPHSELTRSQPSTLMHENHPSPTQVAASPVMTDPDVIIIDEPISTYINHSHQYKERKKQYMRTVEDKLQASLGQSQKLAGMNIQLQKENSLLLQEVNYLKQVLRNQSAIASIIEGSSQVSSVRISSQFDAAKRKSDSDVLDSSVDSSKRFKTGELSPGGICLHILPGSKVASIEACKLCSNFANGVDAS